MTGAEPEAKRSADVRAADLRAADRIDRAAPWLLLGLVAMVYGGALRFAFVYDDRWTLIDNPVIRDLANAPALLSRRFAQAGVPDAGRPLLLFSEMIDWALWGARPLGFHLQNLLWHGAASLMALRLLRRWGHAPKPSVAAAAIFAVHPLVAEPVVVINYREDPLAVALLLAALGCLAPRGGSRTFQRASAAVLVGLATLAKESALVAPVLWAALVTTGPAMGPTAETESISRRERAKDFLVVALPVVAVFLWRWWAHGAAAVVSTTAEIPESHRRWAFAVPRALITFTQGLGQFLWPAQEALAPEYPDLSAGAGLWGAAAGLAVGVVTAVTWRARRRLPGLALGWSIGLASYLPHFGLVPLTNLRADRYFYLSLVGWSLAFVTAASWLLERLHAWSSRRLRPGAAGERGEEAFLGEPKVLALPVALLLAIGLGGLALRARAHARVYRDDVTLFAAATISDPASQRAQVGLALARLRAGQRLAAGEAAARAVALSRSPRALEAAGLVAMEQGDLAAARAALTEAVSRVPSATALDEQRAHKARLLFHLGLVERRSEARAPAAAHWREAVVLAPGFDRPAIALAQLAMETGDRVQARATLQALLARIPGSIDGWQTLATLEETEGHQAAAAEARERVRRLGGRNATESAR